MKNWKLIVVAIAVFFALAASIYAWYLHGRIIDQESKVQIKEKQIQTEATIIARKVDIQGREHVIIEATENIIPFKDLKQAAIGEGILDTTRLYIESLKGRIENLTVINTTLKADNLRAKQVLDEKKNPIYTYTDRYLNLNYRPGDPADTTDQGEFDFKYDADLSVTQFSKRNWFLGAKKSYIDIISSDPRTTIRGVKRLTVEQKQPQFGLRIQAVSGYNFTSGALSTGPGMQFDFKRFSIQGSYQYNFTEKDWRPGLQLRGDLIRF